MVLAFTLCWEALAFGAHIPLEYSQKWSKPSSVLPRPVDYLNARRVPDFSNPNHVPLVHSRQSFFLQLQIAFPASSIPNERLHF